MNRIEIVGLFTALEKLCDKNDLESVKQVVSEVLREARSEKNESEKKTAEK